MKYQFKLEDMHDALSKGISSCDIEVIKDKLVLYRKRFSPEILLGLENNNGNLRLCRYKDPFEEDYTKLIVDDRFVHQIETVADIVRAIRIVDNYMH